MTTRSASPSGGAPSCRGLYRALPTGVRPRCPKRGVRGRGNDDLQLLRFAVDSPSSSAVVGAACPAARCLDESMAISSGRAAILHGLPSVAPAWLVKKARYKTLLPCQRPST
jgi:hypothetical protein